MARQGGFGMGLSWINDQEWLSPNRSFVINQLVSLPWMLQMQSLPVSSACKQNLG